MVISNWVEKKLEDRRLRQQQDFIARLREEGRKEGREEGRVEGRVEGREEGFEQGRAYERERIMKETNGQNDDDTPGENGR